MLLNAAGTLGYPNMQERIDLVQRARKLDPARATEPLARLYSAILLSGNEPGLAAQIRNELQSSTDIALLGSVARHVVEGGVINLSASDRYALAAELVTHAEALEPQNQEWSDLMEGVKAITATVPSVTGQANAPIQPNSVQAIRVGGVVAAANLQQSSPPIYPPLAKAAGVQGTVKLQIRIGADGHVKDITLISGHPCSPPLPWMPRSTMCTNRPCLNGQPTEVLTTVDIVFQLPTP